MGQMITKPDANPILFAVCNLFAAGALGYYLMGQQKKAMISAIIWVVGAIFCCGTISSLIAIVSAYDAYLLGQKLQSGQAIGENENALEFLNSVFKD